LAPASILVIGETNGLAESVKAYMARVNSSCEIFWAGSIADGTRMAARPGVQVVIVEHRGTGAWDGLAFLRSVKGSDLPARVVMIAERGIENQRFDALSLGCDSFLTRPFSVEKLCELVAGMLRPDHGFSGRLVGMKLEDVIQMLCYRRDSTLVSVAKNGTRGTIYINNGEIVHAEVGALSGVEAFCEIISWPDGEFLSQVVLTLPPQTIFMDWQSLLIEGLRDRDEIRHALGPAPMSPFLWEPSQQPGSEAFPDQLDQSGIQKRIMIVDDSRFIRKIVHEIVQGDPELSVVGYASNGQEALAKIDELKPDLILLDWDMPVMKGSTALMHIMIKSPCPVVILSGFVGGVGANPFDLICLGAADFLRKPQSNWRRDGRAEDMIQRIKKACEIKLERVRRLKIPCVVTETAPDEHSRPPSTFVIVLMSSTGGCADLMRIIPTLPDTLPAAVVCLHDMQREALDPLAEYLNARSSVRVASAQPGTVLEDGVCYLHPSVIALELERQGTQFAFKMPLGALTRESSDHFLASASAALGDRLVAAILSGDPGQGLGGLRAVKQAGGTVLVQDPAWSLDPRFAEAALKAGLVDQTHQAGQMAGTLQALIK
jgi:two-component system chemotaxis response regulator CheB